MKPKIDDAAIEYGAALLEACAKAKVADPVSALVNTDFYPKLQKIDGVEWIVGWFRGVADEREIDVEKLWAIYESRARAAFEADKKRRAG